MSLLVWLLGCFFALLLACCWTSLLLLQSLWCLLVWWLAGWLACMSECVCGWFVVANDRWQKGGQEQDHDQEHEQEQEHEQKQKQEQEQEQNQKQEPDFGTHLYGNMSKLIFFFVFFVDAKDFSQTLVILSSMFNLPIFKYATAHWFCLDPALWASFFRTDLCVSFHKFSLFLISPQKNATPHSILMTKFLIFAKYATTHRFCLDPALWANFLEPISVGAVTNSHFFDFRRKFRDPSYYFDDLISVFAKYATTHRFCLDPALWAIFFGTDLYGGFHDF